MWQLNRRSVGVLLWQRHACFSHSQVWFCLRRGSSRRPCVYHTFGSSTWLSVLCFYVRVCTIEQCMLCDLWVCYQCHVLPGTPVILCVQCSPWRRAHTQKYCEGLLQEWPKHWQDQHLAAAALQDCRITSTGCGGKSARRTADYMCCRYQRASGEVTGLCDRLLTMQCCAAA